MSNIVGTRKGGNEKNDTLSSSVDGDKIFGDAGDNNDGQLLTHGHGGNDTITGTGKLQQLFGDTFVFGDQAIGGADHITANRAVPFYSIYEPQYLFGDASSTTSNALVTGGDDTMLAKATAGNVTTTSFGIDQVLYGDLQTISSTSGQLIGGMDTVTAQIITGDFSPFPRITQSAWGDTGNMAGNAVLTGGGDTLTETLSTGNINVNGTNSNLLTFSQVLLGDAGSIAGSAVVTGGSDTLHATITMGVINSLYTAIGQTLYGDVTSIADNAMVTGGNDTLTGDITTSTIVQSKSITQELYGDASTVSGNATLHGGNDILMGNLSTGSVGSGVISQALYGDVKSVLGTATMTGGNDTLISGLGNQIMYGDFVSAASTAHVTTGSDTFQFDVSMNFGNDVVKGFEVAKDTLKFNHVLDVNHDSVINFDDLNATATATDLGNDVKIDVGANSVLITGAGLFGDGAIADLAELNSIIQIQAWG